MKAKNLVLLFVFAGTALQAQPRAKNIILFLADAGGTSTLHAASLHGYGETRKLYVQSMPHIGLSDTSTASNWVSDSAAGMTAIVTGHKTHNGVLSQSAAAVRGKTDGAPLKTILEYAEERGLSTGIITSQAFYDATPAACYAQVNSRGATAEILKSFLNPRFGNGVDVLIGSGRKQALEAAEKAGLDFLGGLQKNGYRLVESLDTLGSGSSRLIALFDTGNFELASALKQTIEILSRNRKGYFLMVEWDAHTSRPREGLDRVVALDRAIQQTAQLVNPRDTLLLFTADHSFDLRVVGGRRGEPLLPASAAAETKSAIKVEGSHTGEEVLVAARGPGAERVKGYLDNTQLFHIMMSAFGWKLRQ
jgi:alkaline phosphatase